MRRPADELTPGPRRSDSPSAAENQLRGVLGEKQAVLPPEEARARAQFLLLAALTVAHDLKELDQVLAEGRALADALIMEL